MNERFGEFSVNLSDWPVSENSSFAKSVAVVIPVYNEASNLMPLYELLKEYVPFGSYCARILFVDDGSSDGSLDIIREIAKSDPHVRGLSLSRNFGKDAALSAGAFYCQNFDAVVFLDSDLQHPPQFIPRLIERWETTDAELVVGIRNGSADNSSFRLLSSRLYNRVFSALSDFEFKEGVTDFRLCSRKTLKAFIALTEKKKFFRGLTDWLGFKTEYVFFDVADRYSGVSSFGKISLFRFALNTLTTFSNIPLKAISYLGLAVFFLSSIVLVSMGLSHLFGVTIISPLAYFMVANTALISLVLITLGIVGHYVGVVVREVQGRPDYIVGSIVTSDGLDR